MHAQRLSYVEILDSFSVLIHITYDVHSTCTERACAENVVNIRIYNETKTIPHTHVSQTNHFH